jgi:serine/threonine protein kinase
MEIQKFLFVFFFVTQVNSLTKVHHRNLVSLVGYCWEKDHLALVYEYMSEGSLTDQLRGLSIKNISNG